jgi:hypothetical protein
MKQNIVAALFGPAITEVNTLLLESMAASILMYLDDVKKYNIVIAEKSVEALQSIGYELDEIKQLSFSIRQKFVVDNIMGFPAESPLLEANEIEDEQIQIPLSSFKDKIDQMMRISNKSLCSKYYEIFSQDLTICSDGRV